MKKKDILILGLTETLLLGLIGSLLGIIIGYGITHQIIGSIFDTVTTLYLPIEVTTIHVTKTLLATTLLIGIATSFCGAILPQIEASYQSLNSNFHEQSGESKYLKRIPMMLTIGILFVSSALLLTKVSYQQEAIFKIIPLIFILGIILTIPALFKISIYLNKTLINIIGDIQLRLAIDHINQTMRRNVTSVTSMVLAIGFCIGITTMIISFRTGVELWIKQALQADLFISPSKSLISSDYLAIPDEVIEKLDSSPLIKDLDYVYPRRINFRGKTIDLAGVSFKIIEKTHRLDFIETTLTPENSQEIYISEVISNKFQIKSGQSIELPTDRGLEKFHVTAIFRDYSSDRGLAMIKAEKFRSSFKNSNPSGLSIYLNKSSTRGEIESLLLHTFPEYNFFIRDNTMLKNEVLAVFDKTFRITYALVGISLFISFLAIFNSILMLLLERKRDFLIFRAIGARKSFVSKMVAYESLIIGTNSSIIGLLVGIALSYFLVHIVTPQFFGWSFVIQFPISLISILVISLIILSIVSGLIPAYFILSNEKTSEVRHVD